MITALAAETLLVSELAWMPRQVSVKLATVLRSVLPPWALLSARRSPGFALMTLAMPAMLRLGEAPKTLFLQSEQHISELQQQQEQRASSKSKYLTLAPSLEYGGARRVRPCASPQSLDEEIQEDRRLHR